MTDKFSTTPVEFRGIWIAVTASKNHRLARCSFLLGFSLDSSSQFLARNDKNLGIGIRFSLPALHHERRFTEAALHSQREI